MDLVNATIATAASSSKAMMADGISAFFSILLNFWTLTLTLVVIGVVLSYKRKITGTVRRH